MESEFLSFVASIFAVPAEGLSAATAYGELPQWDSVMHLRLVLETEARYSVKFDLEEIPRIRTLGGLWGLVRLKMFLRSMAQCLETDKVEAGTAFRETQGWCSLMAFSMLLSLERKFGAELSLADLSKCTTLGDVASRAGIALDCGGDGR